MDSEDFEFIDHDELRALVAGYEAISRLWIKIALVVSLPTFLLFLIAKSELLPTVLTVFVWILAWIGAGCTTLCVIALVRTATLLLPAWQVLKNKSC